MVIMRVRLLPSLTYDMMSSHDIAFVPPLCFAVRSITIFIALLAGTVIESSEYELPSVVRC